MDINVQFKIFLLLISTDFILAILVAARNNRLRSRTCANGIYMSIGECIMLFGLMIVNHIVADVNFSKAISSFLFMFCVKESISVIANFKGLGIWIPQTLERALTEELNKHEDKKGE